MISQLVGFEHSYEETVRFLNSYFIFVTYLPREVDGRIISEIDRF